MRKLFLMATVAVIIAACNYSASKQTQQTTKDRLAKAFREDKNGWIFLHLQGSPSDIGYQHGYLAANEIDTTIQAVAYTLAHETKKDWSFYRQAAKNFLWDKLDREYKDEINGIVDGLHAKNKSDVTGRKRSK